MVTAGVVNATSVVVMWTAGSTNEDGFEISRDGAVLGNVQAGVTSYLDGAAPDGGPLTYSVIAFNAGGRSAPTFAEPVTTPLRAPTTVTATVVDATSVLVTWTAGSANAEGFEISRDGAVLGNVQAYAASYLDNTAPDGTSLIYTVIAFNALGRSPAASAEAVTTPLAAPTDLTVLSRTDVSVTLEWVDQSVANTGYDVERDGQFVASLPGEATSFTDVGLTSDMEYVYVVKAAKSGMDAASSSALSARTLQKAVLIDATRDGGVWWFPQSEQFIDYLPHQGKALADDLRSRGYLVEELGRNQTISDSILRRFRYVIRAGIYGAYNLAELDAYGAFLGREGTSLLLIAHYMYPGMRDRLAEMVGTPMSGVYQGTLYPEGSHPIVVGLDNLRYGPGAGLVGASTSSVEVLGRLQDGTPVMGTVEYQSAKVFWLGDLILLERCPSPLLENLLGWAFP
jgi:hypothetical protein